MLVSLHSGRDGFSRSEAIDLVVENFGLDRTAAARQPKRHFPPEMMRVGLLAIRCEDAAVHSDGDGDGWPRQEPVVRGTMARRQQQQARRSVVVSGATFGLSARRPPRVLPRPRPRHGGVRVGRGRGA